MTTLTALIPRIRRHPAGYVVAIRCATCHTWRKPRYIARTGNVCRTCPAGPIRRYLAARAAKHH